MSQISNKVIIGILAISIIALIVGSYGIYYASMISGTLSDISKSLEAQSTKIDEALSRLKIAESNIRDIAEVTGVPIGKPEEIKAIIEHKKLVEAAKREGKVVWYTTIPIRFAEPIADAFEREYGIKVELYRDTAMKLWAKYIAEADAGIPTADVMSAGVPGIWLEYARKGYVIPYESPERVHYPPEVKTKWFTEIRLLLVGIAYNTKLIPFELAPKSYKDVLELAKRPEFKGKIAIGNPVAWSYERERLYLEYKKFGDIIWDWYKVYREAQVFIPPEPAIGVSKLEAGEVAIFTSVLHYYIIEAKKRGAPVEWIPPKEGVVVVTTPVGMMKGGRHPNAAKLFIDWLLSKRGQELLRDVNLVYSPRADVAPPPGLPDLKKMNIVSIKDWGEFEAYHPKLTERWKEIMLYR